MGGRSLRNCFPLSQSFLLVLTEALFALFPGGALNGGGAVCGLAGGVGKIFTLLLTAAALGTDAMSLAIGIGLRGIERRERIKVSLIIGLFHILMPLIGTAGGLFFSRLAGGIARLTGAAIVAVIGGRMVWGAWASRGEGAGLKEWKLTGFSLLLLAFCVSIDAFSVGLGLGALGFNIYLTSLVFGVFGAGMTAVGFRLGVKFCAFAGNYGELAGGVVLVALAVKMFLEG